MSHQYTTKEVATLFAEHLQHLVEYWTSEKRKTSGEDYSCLDGITHSTFAAIAGVAADIPGFLIVPINENDYTENFKYQKDFQQDVLPLVTKLFKKTNNQFLEKNQAILNVKSINYPYKESTLKDEKSFNINFIRNIWQHIEYWHQQNLAPTEKGIAFMYNVLNVLNGKDLISKTLVVPYFTEEDVEYCKREKENYYTCANYELLNKENSFVVGGNMLHQMMYQYRPTEDKEKIVKEKHFMLEEKKQLENEIKKSNKYKKIKV